VRYHVKAGDLASFTYGRRILIADDVLEAFILGMRLIG
jgi:hypothetical protein